MKNRIRMEFLEGSAAVWRLATAVLVSRLVLVAFANRLNLHDADRYLQEAANLLRYGTLSGYAVPDPRPLAHDTPAYPLLLALLTFVFKNSWAMLRAAAVVNAFAFTSIAILVYHLLRSVGSSAQRAACAMTVFALFPESLPYSIFVMPECLFMVCFVTCVLFAVKYLREPQSGRLWLAFALLGCSVMLKPASLPFAGVLTLAAWIRFWPQRQMRRAVLSAIAFGLLIEAAVCAPWLVRNYRLFGTASFTTITGSNLFWYNYRYMLLDQGLSEAEVDARLTEEMRQVAAQTPEWDVNPFIQARVLTQLVVSKIAADPFSYTKTVIKRYPNLYSGTGALDLIDMMSRMPRATGARLDQVYEHHPARQPLRVVLAVLLCALYLLIIAGTIVLIRKKIWAPLLLAWIPILYFSAVYGPVTASRYRFVINPFFALLAAYGIPERFLGITNRRSPAGHTSSVSQLKTSVRGVGSFFRGGRTR